MIISIGFCYLQLIGITYLVSILMGAPLLTDVIRTFLFSIYIVLIGFTPIIISLKGNLKEIYDFIFQNEFYLIRSDSKKFFFMKNLVWTTIIGAWLGAIPIPLDWDRWWQRWPITCIVSSTIGAGISIIISYSWLWIRKKQKIDK
jgi:phosphatidylinositol glycan class F